MQLDRSSMSSGSIVSTDARHQPHGSSHASASHGTHPSSFCAWQGFSQQHSNNMHFHVLHWPTYKVPMNLACRAYEHNFSELMMRTAKQQWCKRSCKHDAMDCLDAHPGEQPRLDLHVHKYSNIRCRNFKKGHCNCKWRDECKFAHGIYEIGFHPLQYRTENCWNGPTCNDRGMLCFFAEQLREPTNGLRPFIAHPGLHGGQILPHTMPEAYHSYRMVPQMGRGTSLSAIQHHVQLPNPNPSAPGITGNPLLQPPETCALCGSGVDAANLGRDALLPCGHLLGWE